LGNSLEQILLLMAKSIILKQTKTKKEKRKRKMSVINMNIIKIL